MPPATREVLPWSQSLRWFERPLIHAGSGQNNIARIGRNATLTGIAQDIGLSQHVMLNPAQRTASDKLLATTMEALFAAICECLSITVAK